MGRDLEYELFKSYCKEYNYYKLRLADMNYRGNPAKEDAEYVEILQDEIDELKETIAYMRIKKSDVNLLNEQYEERIAKFNNGNIFNRIKMLFTGI